MCKAHLNVRTFPKSRHLNGTSSTSSCPDIVEGVCEVCSNVRTSRSNVHDHFTLHMQHIGRVADLEVGPSGICPLQDLIVASGLRRGRVIAIDETATVPPDYDTQVAQMGPGPVTNPSSQSKLRA